MGYFFQFATEYFKGLIVAAKFGIVVLRKITGIRKKNQDVRHWQIKMQLVIIGKFANTPQRPGRINWQSALLHFKVLHNTLNGLVLKMQNGRLPFYPPMPYYRY